MADEDEQTSASEPGGARPGVFVGACGFSYDEWDGFVFPPGLAKNDRLAHYASLFRLVELDSTYYGTPRADRVLRWAEQTPPHFVLTAKVPKQITQEARLAGPAALGELGNFVGTMRLLGPRLGPLVFQMSPGFRFPRDFKALATALKALPQLGGEGLRFAVEFRHPSWLERDEPAALLREHGVAWVWNDWLPTEDYLAPIPRAIDAPEAQVVTADDFGYVRLIGNHNARIDYRSITVDRKPDLVRWAELALAFRRGREDRGIYILLNNHYSGSSPTTIRELERLFGLPVVPFGAQAAQTLPAPGGAPTRGAAPAAGQARLPGF
jgi:uncharacterized protein YecE (DUF72 family)